MAHGKRANECNQPQWHDGPSQSARQPIQASVRQTKRRSENAEKSFLIKFPVKLSIFYSLCLPSPFGKFDTMFGFAFVPGTTTMPSKTDEFRQKKSERIKRMFSFKEIAFLWSCRDTKALNSFFKGESKYPRNYPKAAIATAPNGRLNRSVGQSIKTVSRVITRIENKTNGKLMEHNFCFDSAA